MELRMNSLLPEGAVQPLEAQLPVPFASLPESARLALATAQAEGTVNHDRLKQMCREHRADITKMFGKLVRDGLLIAQGVGRGTKYYLPWFPKTPELAVYLDWEDIPPAMQSRLLALVEPVASKGKFSAVLLRETILALCQGHYLGLRVLAQALQRDNDDLRKRTLTPMVQAGHLQAAHAAPRDPRQAYTAAPGKAGNG